MSTAEITLPVVMPFAWQTMLNYLQSRLITGREFISHDRYHRTHRGCELTIRFDPQQHALLIEHDTALTETTDLEQRCQRLFAPDAATTHIYAQLNRHFNIPEHFIGFRPLGCWDPFELCIRTIIGQQVSVKAARTLMQRLLDRCGDIVPQAVADSQLDNMGMPGRRVQTLQHFAAQVAQGQLDLKLPWPQLRSELLALPGIGPWTCDYLGIRLGRDDDAFPASDLGLIRAANVDSAKTLLQLSETWHPYRAYAACFLWAGDD